MTALQETVVKGSVVDVDFSGTTAQGLIAAGIYQVVVKSAEVGMSQNNAPKITFKLEILDGEFSGRQLYLTNTLQSHALFSFRKSLEALGVEVPQSKMGIDVRKLVGLQMNAQVELEEYKGALKPKVVDVGPIHYDESVEPGEDPEPLPMKKAPETAEESKKKKASKDDDDPELKI